MSAAKVTLSPKELELVNNADWILTKNHIIQKVNDLFSTLANGYRQEYLQYDAFAKSPVFEIPPKISKGEQYQLLPYVMLDFPRCFTDDDIFAVRTFFWWGNHCSIHLILKGKFLAQYGQSIDRYFQLYGKYGVETKDWFIGNADSPWQHHFEKNNYTPIQDWNGYSVTMLPFLKLAKKIPLEEWDDIESFMLNHFKKMLTILTDY
jgi:peptidoglycan/xylan/chitin deacetylase (PgdA/CDA1 family)